MPKIMVKRFQVTLQVYERKARASYYYSSDAESALRIAIVRLKENGIFLENIEELRESIIDQGMK